jgi:hypothetical protein
MATISILKNVNRGGVPCMETVGATLSTSALTYTFNPHPFVGNFFQGLFAVKVSGTPTAPTTAVPVNFTTEGVGGSTVVLYDAAGKELTTATWPGDGVYLFWYDRTTNITRLMTTLPTATTS